MAVTTAKYRGADKSLALPGMKQAAATKLSAAAMTSASDEKWRLFNCFFQSGRAKDLSAPLYI